jgi:hypothetical protein
VREDGGLLRWRTMGPLHDVRSCIPANVTNPRCTRPLSPPRGERVRVRGFFSRDRKGKARPGGPLTLSLSPLRWGEGTGEQDRRLIKLAARRRISPESTPGAEAHATCRSERAKLRRREARRPTCHSEPAEPRRGGARRRIPRLCAKGLPPPQTSGSLAPSSLRSSGQASVSAFAGLRRLWMTHEARTPLVPQHAPRIALLPLGEGGPKGRMRAVPAEEKA